MVIKQKSASPPTNKAQGFQANYAFSHESQVVLAEETHSPSPGPGASIPEGGTASECPGELSVCPLGSWNSWAIDRSQAGPPPRTGAGLGCCSDGERVWPPRRGGYN